MPARPANKVAMAELFIADDGKYILRAKAKQFPRKTALHLLLRAWRRQRASITYFWDKDQSELISRIKGVHKGIPMSVSLSEALQIHNAVRAVSKIPGSLAEVGVFKGGTARIISSARLNSKPLHLFDTFGEGLPQPGQHDDLNWKKGAFRITGDEFGTIKKVLADEENIHFHPGIFPADSSSAIKNERFSFVHLDVDLYESTKNCLEFFFPRMNQGGIILSHDYYGSSGVRKAFDDFFVDKTEAVLPLSTSQCCVIKT